MAAYLSFAIDEDLASATASAVDIFDKDNYGGTLSKTSHVVASNVTFTDTNGRFTLVPVGKFLVCLGLLAVRQNTDGNIEVIVKQNGSALFSKFFHCEAGNITRINLCIIVGTTIANEYLNFEINSDGAETALNKDGTSISIHQL
jgi:hypothetical protein